MKKERFVQLQGDAVVAFQEYGDANGVPVMFCHGWPSSCTMARLTDEPARELGVRIISPDRPGISGSSLQPESKIGAIGRALWNEFSITSVLANFERSLFLAAHPMRTQWQRQCRNGCGQLQSWAARFPWPSLRTREDCCHFTAGCWRSIDRDRNFCEDCSVWRVRFWLCARLSAFGRYF